MGCRQLEALNVKFESNFGFEELFSVRKPVTDRVGREIYVGVRREKRECKKLSGTVNLTGFSSYFVWWIRHIRQQRRLKKNYLGQFPNPVKLTIPDSFLHCVLIMKTPLWGCED